MSELDQDPIEEFYRDSLATVDKQGKRIWIFPKMPKGKFYEYRKLLSYVLLVVLFGLPWLRWNGEPLFLFNILDREFILFGVHFVPQDFHIFVIGMLIMMLFIVLFTVVFGRLFCGWVCPQTIFMEMVFRRIEYWIEGDYNAQKRLDNAPWDRDKIIKRVAKHSIFYGIAFLIGNTFLAYIIGTDALLEIITDPVQEHLGGFTAMVLFSTAFYFVFSNLREQVCTTICPYGRLQGVLLDKNSLAVYYDWVRGEPRGRISKKDPNPADKGDCIDCNLCVKVCPTGIDIRNGIQLECVNCTACMDACDEVMEKIDRPKGLIRMDSHNGIAEKKHSLINARSIAYSIVLLVLVGLEVFLFSSRSDVETLVLRTPGKLYFERDSGIISNLYNYQLINKTDEILPVAFRIVNLDGEVEFVGEQPQTKENDVVEGAMFINIPESLLKDRKTSLILEVYSGDRVLDQTKTTFLGPVK
jgi:cytochrome c oxidase accessory protein FixG